MPIFELEANGKAYEIDAPSMDAAIAAFSGQAQSPGIAERLGKLWQNPPSGPSIIGLAKSIFEGTQGPGMAGSGEFAPQPQTPGMLTEEDVLRQDAARVEEVTRAAKLAQAIMLGSTAAPRGALGSGPVRPQASAPAAPQVPIPTTAVPVVPPPTLRDDLLRASGRIGTKIPEFLASDNMLTQRAASSLRNMPFGGEKIVKSTQETVEGLGRAATRAGQEFGAGSASVAGSEAKDALSEWITQGSKAINKRLYDAVDPLVNPSHIRPLSETSKAASEILLKRTQAALPPGKAVELVLPAIQREGLSYEGVKNLRTSIGEMLDDGIIPEGMSPSELKRIYGALSQDLRGTIAEAGGPQALAAFEKANRVAAQISERRASLAKIIGVKGDAAPEAVFNRLVTMAGSKSSADISRLYQARKAMGSNAWNEVASAAIVRLGRDPQGEFSPQRFLTAYGNLSRDGRTALFRSTGRDDLARALEDINAVSVAIRDKIQQFGNPSGTAQNIFGAGMIGGMVFEPLTFLKTYIGANAIAAALSKPATAKSVAQWAKAYKAITQPPAAGVPSGVNIAAYKIASRNLVNALGGGDGIFQSLQGVVPARTEQQHPSADWRRYKIPSPDR